MSKPSVFDLTQTIKKLIPAWEEHIAETYGSNLNVFDTNKHAFDIAFDKLNKPISDDVLKQCCFVLNLVLVKMTEANKKILDEFDREEDLGRINMFSAKSLRSIWDASSKNEFTCKEIKNLSDNSIAFTSKYHFICSKPYDLDILNNIYGVAHNHIVMAHLNYGIEDCDSDSVASDSTYLAGWLFNRNISNVIKSYNVLLKPKTAEYVVSDLENILNLNTSISKLEKIIAISIYADEIKNKDSSFNISPVEQFFSSNFSEEYKQFRVLHTMFPDLSIIEMYKHLTNRNQTEYESLPELGT